MSAPQRIQGDRVYCHVCENEWDRIEGGLQCPGCESEFVEIIEGTTRDRPDHAPPVPPHPILTMPPPIPPHPRTHQSPEPFRNHNPWAPDPDEDDITTFEFNTGGGRGTVSFTSRTYTLGGGNMNVRRDAAANEIHQNLQRMLGDMVGLNHPGQMPGTMGGGLLFPQTRMDHGFGQQQQINTHPNDYFSMFFPSPSTRDNNQANPWSLFGALLNPGNVSHGDVIFSQQDFDRVMTQLMNQNTSSGPGPASNTAISNLKKKPVDAEMMGSDGKADCSICMDNVALGDSVTVLPCNHWFHEDCVVSWLREHDTCPHCRRSITRTNEGDRFQPTREGRRTSRQNSRRSSVANPMNALQGSQAEPSLPDSPGGLREARSRYYQDQGYGSQSFDRPAQQERQPSNRSQQSTENGAAAGVANWIRGHLPFQGQQ